MDAFWFLFGGYIIPASILFGATLGRQVKGGEGAIRATIIAFAVGLIWPRMFFAAVGSGQ